MVNCCQLGLANATIASSKDGECSLMLRGVRKLTKILISYNLIWTNKWLNYRVFQNLE